MTKLVNTTLSQNQIGDRGGPNDPKWPRSRIRNILIVSQICVRWLVLQLSVSLKGTMTIGRFNLIPRSGLEPTVRFDISGYCSVVSQLILHWIQIKGCQNVIDQKLLTQLYIVDIVASLDVWISRYRSFGNHGTCIAICVVYLWSSNHILWPRICDDKKTLGKGNGGPISWKSSCQDGVSNP